VRDDRPALAHGVLEVVAVGDVGVRIAHPALIVDEQHPAVEADDEDAREHRRKHGLRVEEFADLGAVGERRRRQLQGNAAQRALEAHQPQRDRRRQPARVVFLGVED
jgi:hypothetical protein